mmetsp:Transcript_37555/g.96919  ORF Transcript_37555/g.96919 Transcript_37555/m.96919 type:complete len:289 (-) Transcript_37555:211-1077(-)
MAEVNSDLLCQLLEMGFELEVSQAALRQTSDLGQAANLILTGGVQSVPEGGGGAVGTAGSGASAPSAEPAKGGEATQEQADMATLNLKPKSEAQLAAEKRELQAKIAEKKKEREQEDKRLERERELKRREMGKGLHEAQAKFEDQQRKRERMEAKRERDETAQRRKELQEQLRRDKEERKRAREERENAAKAVESAPKPAAAAAPKPQVEYDSCQVKVVLPDRSTFVSTFAPDAKLMEVYSAVMEKNPVPFQLMNTYPRKVFTDEELLEVSLRDAGLVPRGALATKAL